jgi:predicted nucleotidyltransferase
MISQYEVACRLRAVHQLRVVAENVDNFLSELRPKLEDFGRRHGLRRLEVFGSAVRGLASQDSDIDLLVTLADPAAVGADALFEMAGEVEELLGRPVDFVLRDRLEASTNRLAREQILATAVTLYGE